MNKIKSTTNSVALIGLKNQDDILGSGTGVCISNKNNCSYFLTNNHVCKKAIENKKYTIHGLTGEGDISYTRSNLPFNINFEIMDAEEKLDLCLLKTNSKVKPLSLARSSKELERFDALYTIGAPSGNFPILTKTNFSGFLDRNSVANSMRNGSVHEYLFISDMMHPGHSGSPVFNEKLEIVGLIFAAMRKGERSMTFGSIAIPVEDIKKFLKRNNLI